MHVLANALLAVMRTPYMATSRTVLKQPPVPIIVAINCPPSVPLLDAAADDFPTPSFPAMLATS